MSTHIVFLFHSMLFQYFNLEYCGCEQQLQLFSLELTQINVRTYDTTAICAQHSERSSNRGTLLPERMKSGTHLSRDDMRLSLAKERQVMPQASLSGELPSHKLVFSPFKRALFDKIRGNYPTVSDKTVSISTAGTTFVTMSADWDTLNRNLSTPAPSASQDSRMPQQLKNIKGKAAKPSN